MVDHSLKIKELHADDLVGITIEDIKNKCENIVLVSYLSSMKTLSITRGTGKGRAYEWNQGLMGPG